MTKQNRVPLPRLIYAAVIW